MPSVAVLQAVMGVSTFFGVVGLLAYLYYTLQLRSAERSISSLIAGDALFTAKQIVEILEQFGNDHQARLEALKELTKYGTAQAAALLKKVEGNVDVNKLTAASNKNYRQIALWMAIFFILLALITFAYHKTPTPDPSPPVPIPTPGPASAPAPAAPASAPASAPVVMVPDTLHFRSGPMTSGEGSDFSGWYELCSDPLPANATITPPVTFYLSGDRSCGGWAECQQKSLTATRACWQFRLQGHNDKSGAARQAQSEGHLDVNIQRPR